MKEIGRLQTNYHPNNENSRALPDKFLLFDTRGLTVTDKTDLSFSICLSVSINFPLYDRSYFLAKLRKLQCAWKTLKSDVIRPCHM